MSKIRDITKFLSLTAAENPTNQPLASTDAALDSAEALALITGGNAITVTSGVVNHDDTSSQSSVNNSGSNFIQDITLDTYGHVTAITSAEAGGGGGGTEIVSGNLLSVSPIAATNPAGLGGQVRNLGIYLGQNAGTSGANTDADYQIFLGEQAGYSQNTAQNTISGGMIGIGRYAGRTGGLQSIYIGYLSGNHGGGTSKGYYNVAVGGYALNEDYGEGYNVAVGHGALQDVNTGRHNVAIGYQAMNFGGNNIGGQPIFNVAIGSEAGYRVTGNNNIFVGRQAGGAQSASYDTTGHSNIFMGWQAGYSNQGQRTGSTNVFIGYQSGKVHTTGANNTCVGTSTGLDITSGYSNVLIGDQAGANVYSGYRNVIIGSSTGFTTYSGYHNIYIGYSCNGANSSRSGEIVIGYSLTGKGNNTAYMGSTSNYNPGNNSSWNTTSDERIKTNVTDYTLGLDTLGQVNIKTYNYLSDSDIATAHPELADSDGLVHEGLNTEKTVVGIMAQELEAVLPNSVETRDNGIKSVNKDELFWVMLNSIKELKARVEALENA